MPSKFNVSKDTSKRMYNGIIFDSNLEMRYYRDVILQGVKDGSIVEYELQKPYELQPKFTHKGKTVLSIKYVADFWIRYVDGHEEVIDIKGFADNTALLKRKMFYYKYPNIDYKWVTYNIKWGHGWIDYDELQRLRKEVKKIKKSNM